MWRARSGADNKKASKNYKFTRAKASEKDGTNKRRTINHCQMAGNGQVPSTLLMKRNVFPSSREM